MEDTEQNGEGKAPAVTREQATKEVNEWLDFKRVSDSKRTNLKSSIEAMTELVIDGSISIDDKTKVITHNLKFPFGLEAKIITLQYKPRLMVKEVTNAMRGVKNDDADGRVLGYIVALTGQAREVLRNMETEDYMVSETIAPFFAI